MKVFSKEAFIKAEGYSDYLTSQIWVDECDGKPVRGGFCGEYVADDAWCIEVPDAWEKTAPGLCPHPDYQIVITCHEDTTYADMFVNGHKVKEAKAKRNPADKFNWRIGAQMAFNRLWEKKKKPVKPMNKYAQLFEEKMTEWANEEVKRIFRRFDKLPPVVREVKRHAKPGEWVRIVKAYDSGFETYKTGDVLKVKRLFTTCEGGWVYLEGCDECACAPSEYVVLEGYQPE